MHPECLVYWGFSWCVGDVRKFDILWVLLFGLTSACYIFTKLLQALDERWRSRKIEAIVTFMMVLLPLSQRSIAYWTETASSDFRQAGFVLNVEKSHLVLQQTGKWLGFIVNLMEGKFLLEDKLGSHKTCIKQAYTQSRIPVRCPASIVGKIISMTLAIVMLRTRALYTAIHSWHFWCDNI